MGLCALLLASLSVSAVTTGANIRLLSVCGLVLVTVNVAWMCRVLTPSFVVTKVDVDTGVVSTPKGSGAFSSVWAESD